MNVINSGAMDLISHIRTPFLTKTMIFVTYLGNPGSMALLCLALVLALWLCKKPPYVIQFILTVVSGIVLSEIVKFIFMLPRPANSLIVETGYSFASGHTIAATILFFFIAYSFKPHVKSLFLRRIFIILCSAAALVMGLSRVYLGVHYATDVLFGFLIGLAVSAISVILLQSYERSQRMIESKR